MLEMDQTLEKDEIKKGFKDLGISQVGKNEYFGAENFGASFKRCSILVDIPIVYSHSTCLDK